VTKDARLTAQAAESDPGQKAVLDLASPIV
jgi:hypothetical protein